MIKSSVTITLAQQLASGPFVFCDDLQASCRTAAELGFDAVEILPPSAEDLPVEQLQTLLSSFGLDLAGVGTGTGFVLHGLSLCSPDSQTRSRAIDFISGIIDVGARFGAPAVIGSMQGRIESSVQRGLAIDWLGQALDILGARADGYGLPLIFEPLNRYETNVINTLSQGVELIQSLSAKNVKLLADLFHMNIEEQSICDSLRAAADHIGHIHFVDSNRRPVGYGHTDFAQVGVVLRDIGYSGYVSAEALPYPDPQTAARQTITAFRRYIVGKIPQS